MHVIIYGLFVFFLDDLPALEEPLSFPSRVDMQMRRCCLFLWFLSVYFVLGFICIPHRTWTSFRVVQCLFIRWFCTSVCYYLVLVCPAFSAGTCFPLSLVLVIVCPWYSCDNLFCTCVAQSIVLVHLKFLYLCSYISCTCAPISLVLVLLYLLYLCSYISCTCTCAPTCIVIVYW
jgi:hypothetical protein